MPYALLYEYLPEIAEAETRTVIVLPGYGNPLPPDEYSFCEMFCDEPGCDCRRVFFLVISSKHQKLLAVIAFGWESPAFYVKWMRDKDPQVLAHLMGPILNMGSPQSEFANLLLELFTKKLLPDSDYIERVKRHYTLFRQCIDAPVVVNERKQPLSASRNAACPCGSGKKFKRCCGGR